MFMIQNTEKARANKFLRSWFDRTYEKLWIKEKSSISRGLFQLKLKLLTKEKRNKQLGKMELLPSFYSVTSMYSEHSSVLGFQNNKRHSLKLMPIYEEDEYVDFLIYESNQWSGTYEQSPSLASQSLILSSKTSGSGEKSENKSDRKEDVQEINQCVWKKSKESIKITQENFENEK